MNPHEFQREVERLINRASRENESNTPDYILAQYLMGCLQTFETAVRQREAWYARDHRPGQIRPEKKEQAPS